MEQLPDIAFAGVSIFIFVPSTVQFIKEMFTIEGKPVKVLTFVVALFYAGLALAEVQGLLDSLQPWVTLVFTAFMYALNAMGLYQLAGKLTGVR